MDTQDVINTGFLIYQYSFGSNFKILSPNCFLHPDVNARFLIEMDEKKIWKADLSSKSVGLAYFVYQGTGTKWFDNKQKRKGHKPSLSFSAFLLSQWQ